MEIYIFNFSRIINTDVGVYIFWLLKAWVNISPQKCHGVVKIKFLVKKKSDSPITFARITARKVGFLRRWHSWNSLPASPAVFLGVSEYMSCHH